jgi:hypothetical protein
MVCENCQTASVADLRARAASISGAQISASARRSHLKAVLNFRTATV